MSHDHQKHSRTHLLNFNIILILQHVFTQKTILNAQRPILDAERLVVIHSPQNSQFSTKI